MIVFPKDMPAAKREAHRRIAFAGASNFRDLGGYATTDGRSVKWGVLYRSDTLNQLSKRDQRALNQMGLTRIIDLRSDPEREAEPDRLPTDITTKLIVLPIPDINSQLTRETKQRIIERRIDDVDANALLKDAYIQFVTRFTPEFRSFFQYVLAAAGEPLLFHCTGGKDRTGFAAAMLLRILGVPQSTVIQDYLLTEKYWRRIRSRIFLLVLITRGKKAMQLVKGLTSAKAAFLEGAFAEIVKDYGSFDHYVRTGLGLSQGDIASLKHSLLE